jgi:hypothetical protein
VTIPELFAAVVDVQRAIEETPPGAPELAATVARIAELRGELERTRSALGPLIPDATGPQTPDETSAADLERSLESLMKAARSKQELGSGD